MNEKDDTETREVGAHRPEQTPIGIDAEFAPIARRPRSDDDVTATDDPAPAPGEKTLTRMSSGPAYSVFSKGARRWMVGMSTVACFLSPMTATIYYPALDALSAELRVTIAMINFTITSFMIFQALAPTFYGDLGDMTGRRPALMLAVGIYTCANVGLALQRNYVALLVLRMLQSAGGSGTIPLGIAVVADITTSAERGKYMGILGCGINVGPTLGPVLGGILSEYLGWPAIFWFCAILSAMWLLVFCLTVPESCRKVVGNGSIPAQRWNRPLIGLFRKDQISTGEEQAASRTKLKFPNPLRAVQIVFQKEMSLVLVYNSILYVAFVLVAATLAPIFKETYNFSVLQLGLCYLPYGAGCCIASVGQGYILDWNYARIARKIGFAIDRRRGDDLLNYPIEKARLQPVYPALIAGVLSIAAYGWTLQVRTSVAVPLVLQFVVGLCITGSFSIISTLVVDLNPKSPATATAANNLVRCMMGAIGTAVIDYMLAGIGRGWSFTVVAALPVVLSPMLWAIETRGPKWRREQRAEEERREAETAAA
ncbi:major facilitator superfamily transporter [Plectosphaerella plurivora]|uniref:Major facilitator superfamily transporter n=1 Tax=Plectosphaerella plurivora TaxID=936078 RepID=A0A9P8V1P1_9PEZI|nr:major facilitator superfamily transporter [Plectosphaerella plurivora]